jgi:hypothetical protein
VSLVTGAVLLGAALVVAVLLWDGSHARAHAHHALRYGGLPAWLPKPRTPVRRVLDASAGHPAFSVEGESVRATIGGAQVLVTAVGPSVPEEGHFPVPPVTPARFIVTFSAATRALPIDAGGFGLVDDRGALHRPRVSGLQGAPLPARVGPGTSSSVELRAVIPTGNGAVTWTPAGARRPTASWDYTAEID